MAAQNQITEFFCHDARLLNSKVCSIETQPAMHDVTEWPFSRFIMRLYGFDAKFRAQRCQTYVSRTKKLQIKVVRNWISYKKVPERICLSPPPKVELGTRKIGIFEVLLCREMAIYIQFRTQRCQKYTSHEKKFQIKLVRNWILYKEVCESICLSPLRVELGGWKIDMVKI